MGVSFLDITPEQHEVLRSSGLFGHPSSTLLMLLEAEVSAYADAFVGTKQSSTTWHVMEQRLVTKGDRSYDFFG